MECCSTLVIFSLDVHSMKLIENENRQHSFVPLSRTMDCSLLATCLIKRVGIVFFDQGLDYVSVTGCRCEMNSL